MDKVTEFVNAANERPELKNVRTTFSVSTPQYRVDLDREKARILNVSIDAIYAVMQSTFGSLYVNDFTYKGRNFRVILQSEGRFRRTPDDLRYVYVKSNSGQLVPLSTLLKVERVTGPELVNRFNISRPPRCWAIRATVIRPVRRLRRWRKWPVRFWATTIRCRGSVQPIRKS